MDFIKRADVVKTMLQSGQTKADLSVKDLLIRGILSGALLGFATSLAITATAQTNTPLVGALVFPVGFVMIVLYVTLTNMGSEAPSGIVSKIVALAEAKTNAYATPVRG